LDDFKHFFVALLGLCKRVLQDFTLFLLATEGLLQSKLFLRKDEVSVLDFLCHGLLLHKVRFKSQSFVFKPADLAGELCDFLITFDFELLVGKFFLQDVQLLLDVVHMASVGSQKVLLVHLHLVFVKLVQLDQVGIEILEESESSLLHPYVPCFLLRTAFMLRYSGWRLGA
jgi:hypothetical protein